MCQRLTQKGLLIDLKLTKKGLETEFSYLPTQLTKSIPTQFCVNHKSPPIPYTEHINRERGELVNREQELKFERCADFLASMMEKYGDKLLQSIEAPSQDREEEQDP